MPAMPIVGLRIRRKIKHAIVYLCSYLSYILYVMLYQIATDVLNYGNWANHKCVKIRRESKQ